MSHLTEELIQNCKNQDAEAQKELYRLYKDQMFGICIRYVKTVADAEDVFIEGFFKVLTKINLYKGEGSFEGWMKRIMINESLMFLRKKNNLHMTIELENIEYSDSDEDFAEDDEYDEIITLIELLPIGYRTVFNLYVFEGYKHREIAEMLGISINTSKSQLILAKKRLLELIKKKETLNNHLNRLNNYEK